MSEKQNTNNSKPKTEKRGFSLPTTSVKVPMPPVKPPKKEDKK